jgi:hypothetical protein
LEAKAERAVDMRGGDFFHSLQFFNAALGLLCLCRLGFKTANKVFNLFDTLLLFFKC